MRIISGKYKGRKIHPPSKMPFTRPTTDVAKEGLFNVLQNNIDLEGLVTLDIFGGTGCISYELASRGAANLTIVEKDPRMYQFIKDNIRDLQIENAVVVKSDVANFIEHCTQKFDLIFAGPPYALTWLNDIPRLVREHGLLKSGGWFILEHTPEHHFESEPLFKAKRNYGTTVFSIFVNV
ncbi:MAG: RsmD family RNA methyltransferase [Chitinophagaceae bacterium]|nr:RsmD family RNA methyltransferase [Chitinophagaceae bacterium]